ncbi:PREDICTED: uncharacterized protein LOC104807379 [Tarenaya hassleriana]|uniref:uncharacterized protein LOC104807379 n=1 Tax=Tarenaya hassleriana TaxID=28532 RepID=UPI00053CA9BA|nr:PREDICTED: uncharacterized protein LOC104807379 [Tarenaya hassleriana]XP_010530928.1 PREDICTED: uncharacterized protein LOC104807379 [Tarenaya hassleriana]XP_010530929.1 PREDICTED: uncharacterized protein LOC104807379 [Tarenaya hassleriana]XP_010530930.1 PREDICTED: uncharacterized protein LOC104807379 [Tarenaya hassleriana]
MAVWRIINRSYVKYASSRFTMSYSQASLASSINYAAKQTRICSSDNPNSDICRNPYSVFENVRFLASSVLARMKKEDIEIDGPRLNEQITAPFIRLVTEEGHFVVPRSEALRRAKDKEQDLVEVQKDGNPPVCKIMDYNREKYLRAAKEKERTKAKKAEATLRPTVKEVQFTPKIELKDLKLKADQALRMMERGYRVKCIAVPDKNREFEPEKLMELLSRFASLIEDAVVENGPSVAKKQAFVTVRHAKFGESKKGGIKKLKDVDMKTVPQAPPPKEDSTDDKRSEPDKKETTIADSVEEERYDFVDVSEKPVANRNQPVESHNRYAKREPSNQFSAGRASDNRGSDSRDANRYGPRPPSPQASQPRFPNQHPTGGQPQYQNPQASQPRFPNQDPTGVQPRYQNPQASQPRFPNQAPNQQPTRFQPQSPNQPLNQQQSRPRFPNQQPTRPGAGRSSGPAASGYGIFSNPGKNDNNGDR